MRQPRPNLEYIGTVWSYHGVISREFLFHYSVIYRSPLNPHMYPVNYYSNASDIYFSFSFKVILVCDFYERLSDHSDEEAGDL